MSRGAGIKDHWRKPSPLPMPLVPRTGLFVLRILDTSHLIFFINLEIHVSVFPCRDKEVEAEKI